MEPRIGRMGWIFTDFLLIGVIVLLQNLNKVLK